MENHVFKPRWRHGHHHHKHETFFALAAMVFFALIALGVVASIFFSLAGPADVLDEPGKVASARAACREQNLDRPLVGQARYRNQAYGFEFVYPAKYAVHRQSDCEIMGWPRAVAVLYCADLGCPSYALAVEAWSEPDGFEKERGFPPTRMQRSGETYLSFWQLSDDRELSRALESLKFR